VNMPRPTIPSHRVICSDAIVTHLRSPTAHPLCPRCQKHTKLYRLGDGRRQCAACGKKFSPHGERRERKLRQLADILLCFCLDLPATEAAKITHNRQPTVDLLYRGIRRSIAETHWGPRRIQLSSTVETMDRGFSNSAFCRRCRKRPGCPGRTRGDASVFGVRIEQGEAIRIDPLNDELFLSCGMYHPPVVRGSSKESYAQYGGFICHGTFHRFADRKEDGHLHDGLEQFWSWAGERLRRHHGVRMANLGNYLKELEWKYNHRAIGPIEQACALIPLLPQELFRPGSS